MFKAVDPLPGLFLLELTPLFCPGARITYAGVAASRSNVCRHPSGNVA